MNSREKLARIKAHMNRQAQDVPKWKARAERTLIAWGVTAIVLLALGAAYLAWLSTR